MNKDIMSPDKNKTKKTVLYLLNRLGSSIEGRKKLMKLMFLLEHYNLSSGKLSPEGTLGNDFYIYYYGVFSMKVMNSVNELIEEGKIKEGFPLTIIEDKLELDLDEDLKKRVDRVVEKFGRHSGYKLEVETLEMLGIKPHEKSQYFGQDIGDILQKTKASA
jgi:uncharacterized protein YwgA